MAGQKVTFPDKSTGDTVGATDINQLKIAANGGIDDAAEALAVGNNAVSGLANKVDKETGKGLSTNDYTTTEKNKLAGISANATSNSTDAQLRDRQTHTGTQSADTITDGTTNKAYTATERAKLNGIADGANLYTDAMAIAANAPAVAGASGFQVETLAYQARVKGISGTAISAAELLALDSFVADYKLTVADWSTVKFFIPLTGSNLKTALVKFVVDASGLASMTNNNLAETDYVTSKGLFVGTNNTTLQKWVSTGVILTNNGITASNVACGFLVPDFRTTSSPGQMLADNPASGTSNFFIGTPNSGTKGWFHAGDGSRVQTFSKLTGTHSTSLNGSSAYYLASGGAATEDFTTELTIGKSTQNATVGYSPLSLSGVIITTGLTQVQTQALNVALYKLFVRLGRIIDPGLLAFGDSITYGQGASPNFKRFTTLVSRALNLIEINSGVPTSQLRQQNGSTVGGFDRYTYFINSPIPFKSVLLMYGTNDMLGDANANGTTSIITDYTTKLTTIVNAFVGQGKIVYLASAPWYGAGNATKNLAYFNAQLSVAKATRVPFIDCYNIFLDTGTPGTLIPDNLHPNAAGNLLIADHIIARLQGKPYRDVLVPATLVPANGSVTQSVTMAELKNLSIMLLGSPSTPTTGITFSVSYSADDVALLKITNTTGADITTTATNIRLTLFTDI